MIVNIETYRPKANVKKVIRNQRFRDLQPISKHTSYIFAAAPTKNWKLFVNQNMKNRELSGFISFSDTFY